ncbi:hypothetical protein [Terrimonas pollutisoli]|uniref:hypothetical protein n=1 Tax=Terrimonas pollutisoli TaxID=3034147 RepID=UPI0023EB6495|nr:hypothetical protein [Terrimonas sp. H1YJ31]
MSQSDGWIKYADDQNHIVTVTTESSLNKRFPFGILSSHMLFDVVVGNDASATRSKAI